MLISTIRVRGFSRTSMRRRPPRGIAWRALMIEVEQHLLDLAGTTEACGRPWYFFSTWMRCLLRSFSVRTSDLLDQGGEVGHLALRGGVAGEAEHAADDGGRPLAALEDSSPAPGSAPPRLLGARPGGRN